MSILVVFIGVGEARIFQCFLFWSPNWPLIELFSECSVKVMDKDLSCLTIIED